MSPRYIGQIINLVIWLCFVDGHGQHRTRNFLYFTALNEVINIELFPGFTTGGEITDYKDKQCIINKTLEATAPGNYLDCKTPEAIENNNTRCCKMDGNTSCCG